MSDQAVANFDQLLRLRRSRPFRPFLIRKPDGEEVTVTERFSFACHQPQDTDRPRGVAHDAEGRQLDFRLGEVEIIELEASVT